MFFSDNAVVVQLSKYRPMNAREARLIAYLTQFQLNIRHVAGIRNCTADFLSRMCEGLDEKQIEQMRPSQNLINEEFILPVSETQSATPQVVTKGLHDSVRSQEDKFQGVWAVDDVHFGPVQRKTITNAVNSEQSLSNLNPEAAEYQPHGYTGYDPLGETIRALDNQSTSYLFIPRRSSRIQERRINNSPNGQSISTTDQCVKADASVQPDINSDDGDGNASTVDANRLLSRRNADQATQHRNVTQSHSDRNRTMETMETTTKPGYKKTQRQRRTTKIDSKMRYNSKTVQ